METAAYHLFRTFGRGIRFLIALATLAVVMTTAGCRQDRGTWEEEEAGTGTRYRLWFREPATMWEAALPLGNGHLGMMPDGHLREETIVLNDITLWSGGVQDADNPEAAEHLPEIRRLLFEGRNDLAQELVYNTFRCKGAGSGHGNGTKVPYGSYELLGHLRLHYEGDTAADPMDYHRALSLDDAMATTRYTLGETGYRRDYFVSFSDDVGLIRLTAGRKGMINVRISLDRPEKFTTTAAGSRLEMTGQVENGTDGKGMRYRTLVSVKTKKGKVTTYGNSLVVSGATEALIYVSAGTDYKNPGFEKAVEEKLTKAMARPYKRIVREHIAAYKAWFDRAEVMLTPNPEREALSTPERLQAFAADPDDNGLAALYFQYGRYLLISSTHAGLLPPNLQGLWAHTINTPWNGDYHLNINVQMNHWPAEITNLAELHRPLIELTKGLVEPGGKTAAAFYNARGWVAHMMTNVWGFTAPGEHPSWGATNTGGAWLCAHLWEHFDYNRDTAYLQEIYPVLKGAAQFFLDMLVKEPHHGWLVTAPTTSPENAFLMPGSRQPVNICMGSTMDNQLIRELFGNTLRAGEILGVDGDFREQLAAAAAQLPPSRTGSDGRLMEWLEDYEEADPHHRHVSHLYGLHPGSEITPEGTPDLAAAARKSLERRGDGGTGWSRAWKINFWARLHDGNHAFVLLKNLLDPAFDTSFNYANKGGTYPNLFCAHPPFQMDGNWGGCAGIAEMLLQSHAGFLNIAPALPDAFREGSFRGLRARGGFTVSASWKEKTVTRATIDASCHADLHLKIPAGTTSFQASLNGEPLEPASGEGFIHLGMTKGDQLELTFQ